MCLPNILPITSAVVSGIATSAIWIPKKVQPNSLSYKGVPSGDVDHEACERSGDPVVHERVDAQLQEDDSTEFDVFCFVRVVAFHVHLHEVQEVDHWSQKHIKCKE